MTAGEEAISLLKELIAIPSFSREEQLTADLLGNYCKKRGLEISRSKNNIWVKNKFFDPKKPVVLLNSHHDTVKPNAGYTKDPFAAIASEGKLFGLGSNDAGGALVSLLTTFLHFYNEKNLSCNLIFAATAEEEISGVNGIESILPHLGSIDLAIVGEPTSMQMAIAEKGLMVLDCTVRGSAGHAARNEGENAIYKALKDIQWFETFKFPLESHALGPIHMNVTQINAGTQHNVVPDVCTFVVDVRLTNAYSHEQILDIIKKNITCQVKARSTRLKASGIDQNHTVIQLAKKLGIQTYGSPTMSDQALMPFPSIKLGPGDSERSHSADEFIYAQQIEEGIKIYIALLNGYFSQKESLKRQLEA